MRASSSVKLGLPSWLSAASIAAAFWLLGSSLDTRIDSIVANRSRATSRWRRASVDKSAVSSWDSKRSMSRSANASSVVALPYPLSRSLVSNQENIPYGLSGLYGWVLASSNSAFRSARSSALRRKDSSSAALLASRASCALSSVGVTVPTSTPGCA